MRMRPFPTSLPNASAKFRSARATRPFTARGCKRIVGIAQTPRQHLHHVAVDFRAGFPNCVEIRLAYKIQFGVAERRDRSGARRAVDHGQFAYHRPRSENAKNAFTTVRCADARFEQTLLYSVASVSFIPGQEQRLLGVKGY